MNVRGRWHIVKTPGYDMFLSGAYIQFDEHDGAFVIDCLTGTIENQCEGDAAKFDWWGNDEMEPANGDGWAEVQSDGTLKGEICLLNGDDIPFIARRPKTSSTAC